MRIAFVSLMGSAPWGGSEALWHSIAVYALQQGNQVFASVYDWGKPHEKIQLLQRQGADISYRIRFNADAGSVEKLVRFIKNRKPSLNKDYQEIIDFKPDAVFISQGDTFDIAIHHRALHELLKKNQLSYSLVCHSHSQFGFIPPAEIYPGAVEIFKGAAFVFFVSKRQWQLTERRLVCKLTNALFTWNPLSIQIPTEPLQWPASDTIEMAIVGSIDGNKGHDTAFEALAAQQWKERNWVLNLYGDGPGKKYLHDLANFYEISERVKFHGHVSNILEVWKKNQILLIPSAGEGLPISLAEAMACGRPAAVTDVGGNKELITEDETGFIAASPTTSSFAAAIEKAWLEKEEWRQLGLNAFNKIKKEVDEKPQAKIYELLINRK